MHNRWLWGLLHGEVPRFVLYEVDGSNNHESVVTAHTTKHCRVSVRERVRTESRHWTTTETDGTGQVRVRSRLGFSTQQAMTCTYLAPRA